MIISYNGKTPETEQSAFVAENAAVTGDVTLGKDSSVWFSAVIRGDGPHIEIGERSNIQDGCVLHADPGYPLMVGSRVTIGHGAILHGCTVGDGSLIGMGAIVLNGAKIGKNCIVGAGALVTGGKEFEDGMLILGSPAKAVRRLTPVEIASNLSSAKHYVEQAKEYAE
ncbi:MAG: gamma carbonic anhydrase family protein [Firmicutes bacterium]|nr:gamma carbonic anhydrase family protein [Bacillota bacterium]MBR6971065.1 gamma carbonic anhydrase family protein [Bacillota bacterium]